eukprot:31418-Pelagococcus_subviridis.AAC.4
MAVRRAHASTFALLAARGERRRDVVACATDERRDVRGVKNASARVRVGCESAPRGCVRCARACARASRASRGRRSRSVPRGVFGSSNASPARSQAASGRDVCGSERSRNFCREGTIARPRASHFARRARGEHVAPPRPRASPLKEATGGRRLRARRREAATRWRSRSRSRSSGSRARLS